MDIHTIRQELRTRSLYDLPLRVTYYARVSSESDEQLNSLGNQIQYYEDLIRKNSAWTFVPGYIDEGLSGISTKRQGKFQPHGGGCGSGSLRPDPHQGNLPVAGTPLIPSASPGSF